MQEAGIITSIDPLYAIPGGEIVIECENFDAGGQDPGSVYAAKVPLKLTAASSERVIARVPTEIVDGELAVTLGLDGHEGGSKTLVVGKKLAEDMHMVGNPAVDPADGSIILTRSGSRGQQLPVTLFRLENDGYLDEFQEAILNPTGLAFGTDGQLFVTNRAQGEVYILNRGGGSAIFAAGLGIASGLAFDRSGTMYVGDRTGTIHRVHDFSDVETFAVVEPSVAAHHLAFSPSDELFLTAPGFASKDGIYRVASDGSVSTFFRGLGRPQGLAFDTDGNLYVAACYKGRHGIVRIDSEGRSCEQILAGDNIVGLCFSKSGDMIVATSDSIFSVPFGIQGLLLNR